MLEKLAVNKKALAVHDKQHETDNSVKTIAELTHSFADIDAKVKDVEARILQGVINLQHEINTRELQLEKLDQEQNDLRATSRKARSLCNECTTREQDAPRIDMPEVT